MKFRLTMLAMLVALAGTFVLAPFSAAAAPSAASTKNPLTKTIYKQGQTTITAAVQSFSVADGQLVANTLFTATNTKTGETATTTQAVPVINASGTCKILQLDLGPIHLDLLGLVVDLNAIHLTINAQSGPGNLLGNLLCAVAGLLDQPPTLGVLNQIATLLNQILGLLG